MLNLADQISINNLIYDCLPKLTPSTSLVGFLFFLEQPIQLRVDPCNDLSQVLFILREFIFVDIDDQ
jgi:hypothetical protein